MSSIKLLCTSVFLTVSALSFAQIGVKIGQGGIHGEWVNSDFGYQISLLINPDGSGVFDGEHFTYTTQANTLSISQDSKTTVYHYQLAGNTLTLTDGDLVSPVSFTRSGTMTAHTNNNNTIEADSQSKDIIGTWSGNGESIEFKSNGQCSYLGQSFAYELAEGQVTFITSQGNLVLGYSIQGDQLSLSMNGQTINYSKVLNANTSTPDKQSSDKGSIPAELAGQWCYIDVNSYNQGSSASSRCITLNANGTYEYFSEASRSVNTPDLYGGTNSQESDRGTWHVQGDRIYYNSQTTGQGSYRLEKRNHPKNVNDPMIVLDGEAYVTATQKAPWR